jgi:hypothetical protein
MAAVMGVVAGDANAQCIAGLKQILQPAGVIAGIAGVIALIRIVAGVRQCDARRRRVGDREVGGRFRMDLTVVADG